MAITPFKVIQGHRFWYQSKAHIRLPISDYLISCTVSKLWVIIGQTFASESGLSHFIALPEVTPANIAINDISLILWSTFPLQKVLAYLQPLLRNPPRKLPNSVKLNGFWGYYAVQGHSRYQSKAHNTTSY